MKQILWSAVTAAFLFASCAKDDAEVLSIPASDDFTATLATESRTVLDGTSVLWETDDEITVFTKTAHNRQYKVKELNASGRDATFTYVGFTGSDNSAVEANYAIYPYDANASITGDVLYTTLAAEQVYDAEKVDLGNALMVAKSSDQSFAFKNAGALLRFELSKENLPDSYTLQSIELVSASTKLAGPVAINVGAASTAVVLEDGVQKVTLTEINTEITTEAKSFYVALPELNVAADDLTVTFVYAEGEKSFTLPAFALAQNSIKTIRYTIKADDFTGTTPEYGEVKLTATEPEQLAQELTVALNDPEVTSIVFPELPEGTAVELDETLTFGAAASRATTELAGRDLTIDGNGATLTYKGTAGTAGRIIDVRKEAVGMNLTLKNITLVNDLDSFIERGVNYNTNGKLTLDNVTMKVEKGSITYALSFPSNAANATVEIKNSYIQGKIALNLWGEKMQVDIVDSELYNYDDAGHEDYSTIALNNDGTNAAFGSVVTVKGGKLVSKNENGEAANVVLNQVMGTVTIDPSTEVVGSLKNAVAIVDYGTNNFYSSFTLQAAIDRAAQSKVSAVVRLIGDVEVSDLVKIPEGASVTIDLNGQNVTNVANDVMKNKGVFYVENNRSLTLIGEGNVVATSCSCVDLQGGSVTIKGGNYEGKYACQAVYVSTGKATIEGGSYKVDGQYYDDNNELVQYGQHLLLNCNTANYDNGEANIVVTGGTFYGGFNPDNNEAEGKNTDFVPEGYKSTVVESGVWTVTAE